MHPVHEVDAILLLSLSVAAKRRPASLAEILAAIDLAYGAIPSAAQLSKSFASLSAHGLIVGIDSNSISKVKQGGDERTTKTVHSVRLGVSEEANTVSPMKWNWNYLLRFFAADFFFGAMSPHAPTPNSFFFSVSGPVSSSSTKSILVLSMSTLTTLTRTRSPRR